MGSYRYGTGRRDYYYMVGQYNRYIERVVTDMVPANHTNITAVSWYHMSIAYIITYIVPANCTIITLIGQYQRYVLCAVADMVL
jgi:hypothetical protein